MSTKINVRSPFYKRYSASGLTAVELEIFIYSGTKTTDKGTSKYKLKKYALDGNDHIIVEFSDLIRSYIEPTSATPLNSNKDYIKWVQIEETLFKNFDPTLGGFTGFAVAQDGTITNPSNPDARKVREFQHVKSVNDDSEPDGFIAGTETTPPAYPANTSGSAITRTLFVLYNIPAGFNNSGSPVKQVLTASQPSS